MERFFLIIYLSFFYKQSTFAYTLRVITLGKKLFASYHHLNSKSNIQESMAEVVLWQLYSRGHGRLFLSSHMTVPSEITKF